MRGGYVELVEYVAKHGRQVSPRGQATRELEDVTIVTDPMDAVPVGVGRGLNLAIASAEYCQLVAGLSNAAQLLAISKNFAWSMNGDRLRGAYGPRLYHQIPDLITRLSADADSRQGTLTLWRPNELKDVNTNDVPCTLALSYTIRGGRLNAHTLMRSNDVFLGTAYDIPIFTALQRTLAWCLNVGVGTYTHVAWSLHLYDRDSKAAGLLHPPDKAGRMHDPVPPIRSDLGIGAPLARWRAVQVLAQAAMLGTYDSVPGWPDSAMAHRNLLADYVTDGELCGNCRYWVPIESMKNPGQCQVCFNRK